ncbi:hypothetical protein [Reyranella sp.]|uniref:hypothetical protein n=1 Tax=Reyranella sp. TaxID=1929291 RepID=UPI003BA87DC8
MGFVDNGVVMAEKPEPMALAEVAAMGIAAMAIATEMLLQFERKGLITHAEGTDILDAALAGLEDTELDEMHPSFRSARTLLDGQLAGWQRRHGG